MNSTFLLAECYQYGIGTEEDWAQAFFWYTVCAEQGAPLILREVRTLAEAKALPCAFNNWAVFFKGEFQTVNLTVDPAAIRRILKK